MATKKSKAPATDAGIDSVIRKNLKKLAKPGVVSVRPGLRISNGMLTDEPSAPSPPVSVEKPVPGLAFDQSALPTTAPLSGAVAAQAPMPPKNTAMISQPARATCLIESLGAPSPATGLVSGEITGARIALVAASKTLIIIS